MQKVFTCEATDYCKLLLLAKLLTIAKALQLLAVLVCEAFAVQGRGKGRGKGQGVGCGVGRGFSIVEFWQTVKKLQSHCKTTAKKTAKLPNPTLSTVWFVFCFLFCSFCSDRDMYRKNGHLACKNRANRRGGSAGLGVSFAVHCKTAKRLIFKDFLTLSSA
jgi:hypothetical protein